MKEQEKEEKYIEETSPRKGEEGYRKNKELKADYSYLDNHGEETKKISWLPIIIMASIAILIIIGMIIIFHFME